LPTTTTLTLVFTELAPEDDDDCCPPPPPLVWGGGWVAGNVRMGKSTYKLYIIGFTALIWAIVQTIDFEQVGWAETNTLWENKGEIG
jgi:hypothetical protein